MFTTRILALSNDVTDLALASVPTDFADPALGSTFVMASDPALDPNILATQLLALYIAMLQLGSRLCTEFCLRPGS